MTLHDVEKNPNAIMAPADIIYVDDTLQNAEKLSKDKLDDEKDNDVLVSDNLPSSKPSTLTANGDRLEEGIDDPSHLPPASVHSHQLARVVSRSQRRGLLGRFTVVAEVENPLDYPRRTKWFITFVVALAAVAAPLGSTIFFRTYRLCAPHIS